MFYIGKKQDDGSAGIDDSNGSHGYQTRELANKAAEALALQVDDAIAVFELVGVYRRQYTVREEGPGSSVPRQDPRARHG